MISRGTSLEDANSPNLSLLLSCVPNQVSRYGFSAIIQFHNSNMQESCSEEIERTLVEKFGARKKYSALINRSPFTLFTILRLEHWARWF